MNIINRLNYQLSKIEELLNKDLENRVITYNYLICEDNCKFLDKYELQTYITETKIENLGFLNSINERCSNIIKLWNLDFETLPDKTLDKAFIYNDPETGKYFNSVLDFHAIYLNEEKWQFYNTDLGKIQFIKNYDYESYSIADIASRCSLILNWVTGTFPDSKSEVHPDIFFQNYLKHGIFSLQSPIKLYDKNNIELIRKRIEEYQSRYKYIYNKLSSKKQLEFQEQVLNHLKEVKNVQIFPICETDLNNLIEEIREQRKNHKIAFDLVGKNNANTVNIVYHHIEEILNKYNISYSEARQILLNMQGSFSPKQIETIVEPIITYLERSNDTTLSKLKTEAIELPDKKNINKSNNLPVFDAQIIDTILEILNVHFRNQNKELKSLLENQHKPTEKLNFTNNGNKLADFFKQLFEAKLISNCTKKELEQWIFENFTFKSGGTQKDFKLKTLEDIISNKGAKPPCMNPLIKMENGKVIKV